MKNYYLILIAGLLITNPILAQDWCTAPPMGVVQGGFRITGAKVGCAPMQVNVEKTVGDNYQYIYDYRGGNPLTNGLLRSIEENVYISPGSYRILQLGSNGSGSVFCDRVEVLAKPNFTATICSGLRVLVNIANDTLNRRYDAFSIDWGDGSAATRINRNATAATTSVHTYPTNNRFSYDVRVTGVYQGNLINCQQPASQIVQLSNANLNSASIRRVTVRNDGNVDVLVRGTQGLNAELQMATGNGNFMNTGQMIARNDTLTLTVRNIDPTKNSYCFKLSASDACDNVGGSGAVCTVSLQATPQNNQNSLQWTQYPINADFVTYRVTRQTTPLAGVTSAVVTQYTDRVVSCGTEYAYQLVVVLNNGVESLSEVRRVKAISSDQPSVPRNPVVSVAPNDQSIEVRALPPLTGATPDNYKVIFLRAENGSNDFQEVATKEKALLLTDTEVQPAEKSYCYRIQYENACGNRSEPTTTVCSIRLFSRSGNSIDWTADSPFGTSVSRYVLEKLTTDGTLVDQIQVGGNTTFQPNLDDPDQQLFRYRVLAFAPGNVLLSYSNAYIFRKPAQLYLPSAFTPNGDGKNDVFGVKGLFLDKFRMIIYNRWGNAVFETEVATKGWDGNINGQPAAEGMYIYKIEITDSLNERYQKSGALTLIR